MRALRIDANIHGIIRLFKVMAIAAVAFAMAPVGEASADATEAALQKANAYIEATKSTERAVDSWDRYASWVNMKTGPTGKERYIDYGMYDVSDPDSIFKEAREAAGAEPKSEKLDAAMTRFMGAYAAVAPLFNEGAAYYDAKGYEADKMAKGQELHKKMLPLAKTFLAEREAMLAELRPFVRDVEQKELVAMEAAEGRKASWHVGNVMHAANSLIDVFPRIRPQPMDSEMLEEQMNALGPDTSPEKFEQVMAGVVPPQNVVIDVTRYSEAVEKLAEAVKVFEGFNGEKPDDFDDFKPLPKKLLAASRALEGPLKKSQGRDFEGGGRLAGQVNQVFIEMINTGSPLMASQLRYLP